MEDNQTPDAVREVADLLADARNELAECVAGARAANAALWQSIARARSVAGVTVDDIVDAIGRSRNYVDSAYSLYKRTNSRVPDGAGRSKEDAIRGLVVSGDEKTNADRRLREARARRDELIINAYQSNTLGPSEIAPLAGIDRNHVLRIARSAGIGPVYKTNIRNQYTANR